MAIMIPGVQSLRDPDTSAGELQLYEILHQLPDSYYVLHSTRWNEQRRRSEYSKHTYIEWGEADFTVFHPKYGIMVFEVKDGLISYNRELGWIQTNRKTAQKKIIDPLKQAEKSMFYFLKLLKQKFGEYVPYKVCSAVWFTTMDRTCITGSLPIDYHEETVLWANDMENPGNAERAIKRAFNFYCPKQVESTHELTQQVLDVLAPEFGAFQSMRSRTMAAKALFFQMTLEQTYLLDYLEEQEEAAIHGAAGTGKTVLAVKKAQRLAKNDKVLFLCFNRFLKEHLITAYSDPNVEFTNLDSLYVCKTGNFLPSSSREKNEAILEFLLDWDSVSWPYHHIIIDEGQDFNDEHLQALHEIAKAQKGCFYVFYDRNQFVQGVTFPYWLNSMECRLILSRNCRNTKEIAITSTRPIGIDKDRIKMRRNISADDCFAPPKPNLFFVKDKEELKTYLIQLFKKYTAAGIKKRDIVVLSCKSDGDSSLNSSDLLLTPSYKLTQTKNETDILFTTVRKFKGLEADAIICIDIDEETFSTEKERNAFYVGTSRATTYLELLTLSEPPDLAVALTGKRMSRPRSINVVSTELCVKIGSKADLAPQ